MKKKFITLVIALLMLFSLAACNDYDLAYYKITAKAEIENYATESNYCEDNWSVVCSIVETGKAAINAAKNKAGVDTAVTTAKEEIDEVEKDSTGIFYSLQEAFDDEMLTIDELMNIAYYHGSLGGVNGTFIPTPKNPESLSAEVSNKICRAYFALYVEPHVNEYDVVTIGDVEISVYYGTYNEIIVVRMKDNFGFAGVIREVHIAGITFEYNSGNNIIVWKTN